jgi:hypothetical protein
MLNGQCACLTVAGGADATQGGGAAENITLSLTVLSFFIFHFFTQFPHPPTLFKVHRYETAIYIQSIDCLHLAYIYYLFLIVVESWLHPW